MHLSDAVAGEMFHYWMMAAVGDPTGV